MQRIDPARWERCQRLARQLLLVSPRGEDLVRRYLDVLIDRGLPAAPPLWSRCGITTPTSTR